MCRLSFLSIFALSVASICVAQPSNAQATALNIQVKEALKEQVRSISLLVRALEEKDRTNTYILAAAQTDYQRILSTLYEHGYYSSTIYIRINGKEVSQLSPFAEIGVITTAEIVVNEGPVFSFGKATVVPLPSNASLSPDFATGKTAKSTEIVEANETAISAWRQNGRPKARVSNTSIVADHSIKTLDVVVLIDKGGVASFGSLRVTGYKRMRPNRIRKIAGLPEGEVFSLDELNKAADRLRATGIFSNVNFVEADEIDRDGNLAITAEVIEAKLRRFTFGASLSTNSGIALESSWLHRNLFGGGEQLRFDAKISGLAGETDGTDYEFGASLARPATLTPDTRASFDLFYGRYEEPSYTLEELSVGFNLDHRFSDNLIASAGLKYSDEDTDDVFGQRNFKLLSVPLTLAYDTRGSKLSPSKGVFISFGATPFLDLIGSNDGARLTFDGRAYRSIGTNRNAVLAGRLQLGTLIGPSLADTPADFLFYSGGGGTVRGQDYQVLGATHSSGETVGGKSFVGLSAELRMPIKGIFGGVLFADYGYIGESSVLGQKGDSHSGIGVGLRIDTGIGPVRIDVATPLNGGSESADFNLYIGIGQAF
jgi:translocation and assembly module TamA